MKPSNFEELFYNIMQDKANNNMLRYSIKNINK